MSESKGHETIGRREFLRTTFIVLGGVGIGVGGPPLLGLAETVFNHDRDKRDKANQEQKTSAEDIGRRVKAEMASDWHYAAVWPGLAILPKSVDLYTTATLHPDTRFKRPEQRKDHLVVQRPFMIKDSLDLNTELKQSASTIGREVMGLWLPDSNDIVFCDREAHRSQILLPTHTSAAVLTADYKGIVGEPISLESAVRRNGLVWRYLKAELVYDDGSNGLPSSAVMINKVCGRSLWADEETAVRAYNDFQTSTTNADFITLPEA